LPLSFGLHFLAHVHCLCFQLMLYTDLDLDLHGRIKIDKWPICCCALRLRIALLARKTASESNTFLVYEKNLQRPVAEQLPLLQLCNIFQEGK